MEENFVPYVEALALKKLGFDVQCNRGWYKKEIIFSTGHNPLNFNIRKPVDYFVSSPLKQQAFKWFRDVHHLDGWVVPYHSLAGKLYTFLIEGIALEDDLENEDYDNYESAELGCIRKLIETVKNKIANG